MCFAELTPSLTQKITPHAPLFRMFFTICLSISRVVYFNKIKNSLAKTSRINAIEIHYKNFTIGLLHKDTNEIIKKYSNIIEDFAKAYEIIYNYRKFNSMEATLKYIEENKESLR